MGLWFLPKSHKRNIATVQQGISRSGWVACKVLEKGEKYYEKWKKNQWNAGSSINGQAVFFAFRYMQNLQLN